MRERDRELTIKQNFDLTLFRVEMSRYEQWKWREPKGKSQWVKIKETKTAQMKNGVIERGHIMNDRKTRSQNFYLPLHIIQRHKDMQCHWENINFTKSFSHADFLSLFKFTLSLLWNGDNILSSPTQKNFLGKYSYNSIMKN